MCIRDSLSGGNQQKVIVARWLANDPDVLIMDEPTRGIDVGAKHEIYEIMSDLAKQGKAIIMISSEMSEPVSYTHLDVYKRQKYDRFDEMVEMFCELRKSKGVTPVCLLYTSRCV